MHARRASRLLSGTTLEVSAITTLNESHPVAEPGPRHSPPGTISGLGPSAAKIRFFMDPGTPPILRAAKTGAPLMASTCTIS